MHVFRSSIKAIFFLFLLYLFGLSLVIMLFQRLPSLEDLSAEQSIAAEVAAADVHNNKSMIPHTNLKLAVPHTFDELRDVRATLEAFNTAYGIDVLLFLTCTYVFLSTFMIPGPLGINILAGSLYPFGTAMLFTSLASTLGAALNFFVIKYLLKDIVISLFPKRIAAFQEELKKHKAHLLNFMIFVLVTPFLHWFVNLASPIVGIPFYIFLIATVLGHQPMNFITVQAGAALSTIESAKDLYSPKNIAFLVAVALLALVPVLWKKKQQKQQQSDRKKSPVKQRIPVLPIIDRSSNG